jgi:hypothetical protein
MLKQDGEDVTPKSVLNVREFFLIFYGGAWSAKAVDVGDAINDLILHYNYGNGDFEMPRHILEVLYLSNDKSPQVMEEFLSDQSQPWVTLPWNDARVL